MSDDDEIDVMLESAMLTYREMAPDGSVLPSPAWADLSPEQRVELHDRQMQASWFSAARIFERYSATVVRVLGYLE
jgi:hypothetical protein